MIRFLQRDRFIHYGSREKISRLSSSSVAWPILWHPAPCRTLFILLLSVIINTNFMASSLSTIWQSTWLLGLWPLMVTLSCSLICTVMNYIDITNGVLADNVVQSIPALLQCFLVGHESSGNMFIKPLRVGNLSWLAQDCQGDRCLVRLLVKLFYHLS